MQKGWSSYNGIVSKRQIDCRKEDKTMGLIKAALGSAGGVLFDRCKEYFYCEAISADVLAVKGEKRTSCRSGNTNGSDNIITSKSIVAVADGQCMLMVEQGKVVEVRAEPGEFTFDTSTESSIFSGDLSEGVGQAFHSIGKRFTFGGEVPKDQRVNYFNTKEIIGNKYGTASPTSFLVMDKRTEIDIDIDIAIRRFDEYSCRATNPLLFYTNICGNVETDYERSQIDSQLETKLLTVLQPTFAHISEMGIRYFALPGHTTELTQTLNDELSAKWGDLRDLDIVSLGVSSVNANEEDEQMIKEMQREVTYSNHTRIANALIRAQTEVMKAAVSNSSIGLAMVFMGMGMTGQMGGMNVQNLYAMGQQQQVQQPTPDPAAPAGWSCTCGQTGNTGNFCAGCGKPKPALAESWQCSCGTAATGKFCLQCCDSFDDGDLQG